VRTTTGTVACIGQGVAYSEAVPAFDTHVPQRVDLPPSKGISAGAGFGCSIDRDGGKVRCWGNNEGRRLGRETPGDVDHWPQPVPGLTGIEELVTHGTTTCARKDATLWCWPDEEGGISEHPLEDRTPEQAFFDHAGLGQMLDFEGEVRDTRMEPSWGGAAYDAGDEVSMYEPGMQVGQRQACMLEAGSLRCKSTSEADPARAPDLTGSGPFEDFAVGAQHGCVLTETEGDLLCWGSSLHGQIGLAPSSRRPPMRVAQGVSRVWATSDATCLATRDGTYRCSSHASDPCSVPRFVPLSGPAGIREMFDAADSPGCIVDLQGALWCSIDNTWTTYVPALEFSSGDASDRTEFTAQSDTLCWLADGRPTCAPWTTPAERARLERSREYEQRMFRRGDTPKTPEPDPLGETFEPMEGMRDAVQLEWVDEFLCARTEQNTARCVEAKSVYSGDGFRLQWTPVRVPPQPIRELSSQGWVREDGIPENIYGLFNKQREYQHQLIRSHQSVVLPRDAKATHAFDDCARLTTGEVVCDHEYPGLEDLNAQSLVGSENHVCAIDEHSSLWCWGSATQGRLGGGDALCSGSPRSLTTAFAKAWGED
jgi:hypothetical protein